MTVAKTYNRKDYTAGAPPNNKIYAFDFKIYDEADLLVYVNGGTPKVLNTDYTVSGGPTWTESGGNVTFVNSLTAGDAVLIYRELTITQGTHWPEGDSFPSASHENAADRLVMLAQQFKEAIGRVFKVVVTSLLTNIEVPEGAGKLWGWNAAGDGAAVYNQIIDTGVITTKGDLVIGSAGGIAERKAIGTESQILEVESGTLAYKNPSHFKLDDWGTPDDNTDLNATGALHGLMSKTDKAKLDGIPAVHKRRVMFPAACFETRAAANWAAFVQRQGTNFDYGELDFDAASQERADSPAFRLTSWDGGSITLRIGWKAAAITDDVIWSFYRIGRVAGEQWDFTLVSTDLSATTVNGTTEYLNESVYTGVPGGWAAGDTVQIIIQRMATLGGDTMAGDAKLLYVELEYTEA